MAILICLHKVFYDSIITVTLQKNSTFEKSAPVAILLEGTQQLVQEDHLARGVHQAVDRVLVTFFATVVRLRGREQEWVVAALFELHDDVEQRQLRSAPLRCPVSRS